MWTQVGDAPGHSLAHQVTTKKGVRERVTFFQRPGSKRVSSSQIRKFYLQADTLQKSECVRPLHRVHLLEAVTVTLQVSCVSVPMAFPKTTVETLKHKINPSAGETFPQAVDALLYTPGKAPLPAPRCQFSDNLMRSGWVQGQPRSERGASVMG